MCKSNTLVFRVIKELGSTYKENVCVLTVGVRIKLILIINFGHNNRIHKKVQITVMITTKVVASMDFFGHGNYCTKNVCAMCTGTKADFSQCIHNIIFNYTYLFGT